LRQIAEFSRDAPSQTIAAKVKDLQICQIAKFDWEFASKATSPRRMGGPYGERPELGQISQ
jgi:hypothetical protein